MSDYEHAKASGYYDAKRISEFCIEAQKTIKRRREELWEEKIDELIAKREKQKNSKFCFFVVVPSRKEAAEYLSNDNSWVSTRDYVMRKWEDDSDEIQKIGKLCSTCNSKYIKLDHNLASLLASWGLEYGEAIINGTYSTSN